MKKAKCGYIGKKSICKIDNDVCGTNGKFWFDEEYGLCTRADCYEQGKKDTIILDMEGESCYNQGRIATLEEVLKNAEIMLCDDWKMRCDNCRVYPKYCDAYRHYLWLEQQLKEAKGK